MLSALEWAEIRALARDGVSQRQIANRSGIHRRTVARALVADAPPRYVRAPTGSQLDPLMPVIERVIREWPGDQRASPDEMLRVERDYQGRSISFVACFRRAVLGRASGPADGISPGAGGPV